MHRRGATALTAAAARAVVLAARPYSTTPQLQRKWFRGLFRWSARKAPRSGEGGQPLPSGPGKLSLFRQGHVPEDLRLPTPADPVTRTAAGLFDMLVAGAGGAAAASAVQFTTGDASLAWTAAQGASLLLWVLRDSLGDDHNRSLGKRLCGVELTNWDGTLAAPSHAALRNWYFFAAPLAAAHPIGEMVWTVMLVFDVSSVFLTPDARKLGDYMFGTRVVNERPDRAGRIRDRLDALEVAALRAELESLSPGWTATAEAAAFPAVSPAEEMQAQLEEEHARGGAADSSSTVTAPTSASVQALPIVSASGINERKGPLG